MTSEPTEVCYVEGETQHELIAPATILFCLYGLGYPFIFASVLFQRDNRRLAKEDQLIRAQQLPDDRENNPNCYEFRKRYGKLYYQFKPEYYYWGLVILARKFMFAWCELMLRTNATFQLCAVLLVMFCAYVAQVRCKPFMSTAEFDKVCIQYVDKIAQLDAEKARKIRSKNDRNMHKNALTGNTISAKDRLKKITREEAFEAAQGVLWNWNNVEATLLMCCVLVCTFGIMFNAEYVDPGTVAYEALGGMVLATIILSMIYYTIVVWSEVVVKIAPSLSFSCFSFKNEKNMDKVKRLKSMKQNLVDNDGFGSEIGGDEIVFDANPMAGGIQMNPMVIEQRESTVSGNLSIEQQAELQDSNKALLEEVKRLKKDLQTLQAGQPATKGKVVKVKKGNFKTGQASGGKGGGGGRGGGDKNFLDPDEEGEL